MIIPLPFASLPNSLDPQTTKDGTPYGPMRYKEIVKECYYISHNINTSYNEALKISPSERELLIKMIAEDIKKQKEQIEKNLKNKN